MSKRKKRVKAQLLLQRKEKEQKTKENNQFEKEARKTRKRQRPIINEEFYKAKELITLEIKAEMQQNEERLKELEEEYAKEHEKPLLDATEDKLSKNKIVQEFLSKS